MAIFANADRFTEAPVRGKVRWDVMTYYNI